jgi:phage-related protein
VAGSFRIAEGYVEVSADESAYDRAMARLKSKDQRIKVGVDLDDRAALAKLDRLARERIITAKIKVDETALSRLRLSHIDVTVTPKMNDTALRRVQAQLDRLTAERVVNIRASVDTRVAAAEIRNLIQRRQVRIGVDVDTRVAADEINNLTRRRTARIVADADTAAARARLDALARDRHANVRVDVDRSALSSLGGGGGGLGGLVSSLTSLSSIAVGALPTVASLGQAIIQMGPAAAVAAPAVLSLGAAFAAIKIGTSGIGDAFKAAFAPATASAGAATKSIRQVENAQRSLAKAQQGVKDAEVNAAAARVQAARQIEDAQRSLKSTVSDVADANRRAAEQVAQAEQDLTDAQKSARQAQLDLTAARKDAARQLEDLANQQKDLELDRREGVLRVQDAQDQLNKTLADPKATQQQRAEAQLTYDEAVQHLQEVQLQQDRLTKDAADANKAGVEGSKQVTDAKGKVADANQTISDKTRALKDAEIEASRTQVEGAQKVADAERAVADAREAARKAAVDGARQIADAQAAVADAARAMADAQTSGAAATNKVGTALAKLAPNARAFVDAVLAQREAWRGLKLDVQNALFAGLGQTFTTMSAAILPSLRTGLTGTATILNQTAKNAASAVTELGKTGMLRRLFDGLNEGMKPLTRIPGQFITGLTQISVAASPAFKRLTTAAGGVADTISKKLGDAFKSGRMADAINTAVGIAKQFGRLIADIAGTIGNVLKAAAAGGGDALGAIGEAFKELRKITAMPEVQKALTSIFTAINAIAKLLAGTLGAVIQAALPLLAALAPVVTELAQKFGPVLADLATSLGKALMPIITALLPVVKDVGGVLVGLVQAVMPLLQPIGNLIATVIKAIAPFIKTLLDALVPFVAMLAQALVPIFAALLPAVQLVGQFLAAMAPLFPQLLTALTPLLPPLGQLIMALLQLAMQVITPLMPLVTGLATLLATVLAGAVNLLVPVITTVIGWLTALADGVKKVVGWIVDAFQWLYDKLVGHSIIPDMVRAIISWFGSLWTGTKKIFTDLKNWVVSTWNSLWDGVRTKWNSFWSGLKSAISGAWTTVRNGVSDLKNGITNTWNNLWNGARDKISSIFSTINGKISTFKSSMKTAFSTLKDSLGTIWDGVKSKIASPVRFVVNSVYNNGIRKMWNSIAGKISSKITLPSISLGFNRGGVVPGSGNKDTVPAMLTPGERILSNQQVAALGGHRGIDAMLGKDRPTKTGGNPTSQQERKRQQATPHFAGGGIIGTIGSAIGGAVSSAASWTKDLVLGGLKAAAQKALSALVRPLINQIPGSGIGNLMRGLVNKGVDGMLGWFGNEDKKAVGGPAVQRALSWVKTQNGLPYQWAGNGNPSWDCSGLMSAIESVIRGERPHRRWATGAFSGSSGPSGWVRNLNSPFVIGITNAGVGHTAGTLAGMNVESSGGAGVHMGKGARGYNDGLFTSRWGFAPAAKFDSGGLLQPGATMSVNATGRPERVLSADHTARLDAMLTSASTGSPVTIQEINISGTFDFSSPASRRAAANSLVAEMKEAIRLYDKARAR